MKVYLDNAATTRLDEQVFEAMLPYLKEEYGNPSSIHAFGRKTRSAIEGARKTVAKLLNVSPSEIFFTSGGTEADNMAIVQSIYTLGIKHAITSKIEHHAVETTLQQLENRGLIKLSWVDVDGNGNVDLNHLEELLKSYEGQTLVSLMHANNEIGTLLPIENVGEICKKYNAIFHSDTVQTMGHYPMDLQKLYIHFITCAAHKFHGPKGVGFLYVNHTIKVKPMIYGGAQERNMRGGTENTHGIIGLAKALELCYNEMDEHISYIKDLKNYMKQQLEATINGIEFNGETGDNSLYTVLNCRFPSHPDAEMLLFNLDIAGIMASGGSACSSGSNQGSHVLRGIKSDTSRASIRFSFCKYTTKEEIDYTVKKLNELLV